jgi:hypothetical protein
MRSPYKPQFSFNPMLGEKNAWDKKPNGRVARSEPDLYAARRAANL